MQTFSEILRALPAGEEKQLVWIKRLHICLLCCVAVFAILITLGWYVNSVVLIYASGALIVIAAICLLAQIALDVSDIRKSTVDSAGWIGGRLDKKFEEEGAIATRLVDGNSRELKSMAARVDAEVITQEKWLEVIKPFSLLVPASLIIVSSGYFNFPSAVQNFAQLFGAALISGLAIGAVTIYLALVKMRRLSSALHRAVGMAEDKNALRFRKVSRKRGR